MTTIISNAISAMQDKLLYGKSEVKRIVGLEIKDSDIELFIRDENGNIKKQYTNNKYWILSANKENNWHQLKGNNHFKFGRQFTDREDFLKCRQALKKKSDTYSIYDSREAAMVLKGLTYYKDLKPQDLAVLSFDIETTGLLFNEESKVLLISNTFRHKGVITKKLFAYDDFNDEGEMIVSWCDWVKKIDPDVLITHNGQSFDIPYLSFIAKKYGVKLRLGRDNSELKTNHYESKFRKDGSQDLHYYKNHIYGREICDTMFVSYKFDVARNFPSYGLKPIIKYVGLEKSNRIFYDAAKIRDNYKDPNEWTKIKEYAKDDADDALALFDLMVSPFFYMSNYIPKPFEEVINGATGSQINSMLVRAYLQEGESIPKTSEIEPIKGGISLGNPGIYKNCWKVDIKSCYPSAILINNLYSKVKDPNAYMYKICEYFTLQRFEYKRLYKETNDSKYLALDQAAKIFINSIFGFCSAPGLNFNDSEVSAKITEFGRKYLSMGMKWATGEDSEYWINNAENN